MAGGLMQLLAWGSQNLKIMGNPNITFFKKVYKTHSNFAMESKRLELNRTDANIYLPTIFKVKIPRNGDLLQQIYFVFEVPEIANNNYEFKWIENFGEALINNYYINIGGVLADRQYGEQLHLQNALGLDPRKRDIYNKMIGNVPTLIDPKLTTGTWTYPTSTPVLPTRKIYIPLNFWFNRDSGSSLPMISLQYSETEITIEIRPLCEIYQLMENYQYRAPRPEVEVEKLHNFIYEGERPYLVSKSVLDIRAYLELNYYFVDIKEREQIVNNSHEYLIEQTLRIDRYTLGENNIFDLILQNPVKEFIWVFKRSDLKTTNQWFDFMDHETHILKEAKIMFNGLDRMDAKDESYYNYVQPFQHHYGCKDGVYVYSFSLFADEFQPSGCCNMSRINKIQFSCVLRNPPANGYSYDLTIYAISYNFLKITSGLAGIVFST